MSDPLFLPYRALGYVTDEVPFATNRRGKETWVVLSVGSSWQIYDTAKLTLELVGPELGARITALAAKGELTFSACGTNIIVCKRVHVTHTWTGHQGRILQLMLFGASFLLSLGSDAQLCIWKLDMSSIVPWKVIPLGNGFRPTCMAHPPTYINKLLVGGADGTVQLWNVSTSTLLYTFPGWGAPICCLEPSPALDVVGVGLGNGDAVVVNVKYDEVLMTFKNAAGAGAATGQRRADDAGLPRATDAAACTSISFRTGTGPPLMAAGGGVGVITVWHLDQRKLACVIGDAHRDALARLAFFPGQPVLMSSARDNAIKQWIFDNADGSSRLLRHRAGHCGTPRLLQFYGADGHVLLSAAEDRELRAFSVIQDQQSRELSQVHTKRRAKRLRMAETELKLPTAVALAASTARERDWANVLTAHAGDASGYTWQLARYRLADEELVLPPKERVDGSVPAPATAVCVSQCGNTGFVGSAEGRLDRYNMQSGRHRGQYCRADPDNPGSLLPAHDSAIIGVGSDACNRLLVSVSHDGRVHVWEYKSGRLEAGLELGSCATRFVLHPHSMLAAVACLDLGVRVVDVQAATVVRRFWGHSDRITSLDFSADAKWVLSAAMDGTVRVWDVPASLCLQVMRLGPPVLCLSLSPDMQLLATSHVNRRGIYLWSNQKLFGAAAGIVPSTAVVPVRLPRLREVTASDGANLTGSSQAAAGSESDAYDSDESGDTALDMGGVGEEDVVAAARGAERCYAEADAAGAPRAVGRGLLTLSGQPVTQWEALIHIDAIKVAAKHDSRQMLNSKHASTHQARNRPEEAPQKPVAAPFFLPSAERLPSETATARGALAGEAAEGGPSVIAQRDAGTSRAPPRGSSTRLEPAGGSQVLRRDASQSSAWRESELMRLLEEGRRSDDFSGATAWLRAASPIQIERAIRSVQLLPPFDEDEVIGCELLFGYALSQLHARTNFDQAQALLGLILHVHGSAIAAVPRLAQQAGDAHTELAAAWVQIDDDMNAVRCMASLLSDAVL